MARPNTLFELSVDDMELIETALRADLGKASSDLLDAPSGPSADTRQHLSRVQDLLGRLHNQKTFYRPSKKAYVSG